ncbi:MAG: hypothetical protein JWN21_1677, partial [Sphingomonas bacterium]|uniref:nucleotidyltransferase substrate binding protein n=1 Tax=Sphingomonas bacterium TaxID=1895847 RepID=UPI00261563E9
MIANQPEKPRWQYRFDKNVLEEQGIVLATVTPKSVIREAFAAKIIRNGDVWMEALDARNKMSHVYSIKVFEQVIEDIRVRFLAVFDDLHMDLLGKVVGER